MIPPHHVAELVLESALFSAPARPTAVVVALAPAVPGVDFGLIDSGYPLGLSVPAQGSSMTDPNAGHPNALPAVGLPQ